MHFYLWSLYLKINKQIESIKINSASLPVILMKIEAPADVAAVFN